MRKPVSLIILTWNGLEVTRACVSSVLERTSHPDFEVIVVDNGSTDGTLEYLRGVAGIRLLENGENLGFVKGNNAGIRATGGDVVLLNNDTEVIQEDWLERIQDTAYSSEDIGVVGCRLVNAEGRLVHAGTYIPVPSFWGQEFPGDERDVGQYETDAEVEGVIFACAYVKREVIEAVGALDEDYFSYYEDTDYCMKARKAGYRTFRCGSATVMHLENASTDLNRMDFSGTFRRSREVFLSKWKDEVAGRYDRKLTWRSFISQDQGEGQAPERLFYSRPSRKILWELDRAGVDVNLGFLEGAERAELADFRINDMKNRGSDRRRPQVLFGPPGCAALADGNRNVGYVFTPYDRFEPGWVKELERLDEVWVTSEFQREAALESGLRGEAVVVPLGVDPDYFHPDVESHTLQGRFVFLAPLEWGPCTASETLLRAFTDEFGPGEDVVLVARVTSPGPGAEVEEAVEAMSLPPARARVVFVMDHDIPDYQAGCLYRSADCLVLAGRRAEQGTAALEALACGVPVVAPRWGGLAELADGRAVLGVECRLVEARDGMRWADPGYEQMRAALRRMVDNADEAGRQASLAGERVRAERSWEKVVSRMLERLGRL